MKPRISFGMIVLNGEPFTRYNLRALYPFAHEIIVVEGAVPGARELATEDGHSIDGTLNVLQSFKEDEDLENKLVIVTKDGFWSEKHEMSQAYAARATGDYLWQVDGDEFYLPEDMANIMQLLADDPSITQISVPMITFWGAPHIATDSWYLMRHQEYHRVFKWGLGYKYVSHRPVMIVDDIGNDLRRQKWLRASQMKQRGIYMYHYSLLLPIQVKNKSTYYRHALWSRRDSAEDWAENVFMQLEKPFRVHNLYKYPSWLFPYKGMQPPQIRQMWADLNADLFPEIALRDNSDSEVLVASQIYRFRAGIIMLGFYPAQVIRFIRRRLLELGRIIIPLEMRTNLKNLLGIKPKR